MKSPWLVRRDRSRRRGRRQTPRALRLGGRRFFSPCHKSMEEKMSGVGSNRVNLVLFIKPSTVINIRDPQIVDGDMLSRGDKIHYFTFAEKPLLRLVRVYCYTRPKVGWVSYTTCVYTSIPLRLLRIDIHPSLPLSQAVLPGWQFYGKINGEFWTPSG